MKFSNTACLAALLLACPLTAPAVYGVDHTYDASGKTLSVKGEKTGPLSAGEVDFNDDELEGSVTVTANNNRLVLTDVDVSTSRSSEYSFGTSGGAVYAWTGDYVSTQANGNTVVLNGGKYEGGIFGGQAHLMGGVMAGVAEASNNTVELRNGSSGAPDLVNASVYGGWATDPSGVGTTKSTGNSLNFYDVKGMTAQQISDFQSLNYNYTEMHAGDVILTLTGTDDTKTTSIANADVNVSVVNLYGKDGGVFKKGDKVVLLKNDNGLDTTGIKTKATITGETGISVTYEVEIQADEKELYLTRTDNKSDVQPGTKAIAEGAAVGLALASESANTSMEFLRDFSLTGGSITPFVHVQASSMRHETGSSINMSTVSLLAGLGTGIETGAGNLSLGAFFEYGKGSYTTHNSFSDYNNVDGDGNSWYMGGGILAKMEFLQTGPGHFYVEGSAHMGTVHNEYDSNDLYDTNGNVAKFDMDSPYYSLHGGIGYVWNMAEGHDLDIYGKYIWTRVQSTDDTLTTKDKFEYDDMDF
ncbi:MAG: autotransporter domain-containing protein [Desulfovibrionaceae bacterium]|nr:autotransporter domain-containing protein [Desulfovibrionaceae bacterium]